MFKKNTAVTGFTFGLVSATDGSDITTGTPVGYYTLDGGAQTAIGDITITHEGNGQWSCDLTAGELNGDVVGLVFTHPSAISVHFTIKTNTVLTSDLSTSIATAQADLDIITGATGVNLLTATQASIDAIIADTNELQLDWLNGGRLDLILDSRASQTSVNTAQADLDIITGTNGATISTASIVAQTTSNWSDTLVTYTDGMAGKRVKNITVVPALDGTINDVTPTTTGFNTTLTGYGDNYFSDALLVVETATDKWQSRPILAYTSTTGRFTFDEAFTVTPTNGSPINVQVTHIHTVAEIQVGLATAASIAALNDIAATDIVSAGAIITLAGAVVNVDLVDVTTTNTDMRGTDSAATAANLAIAQADLNTITGIDGVITSSASVTSIQTGLATAASIAALNDIAATDIVSAGPITTLVGAVVNVDLVDVTTTNTDMRGTDSAATAANLAIVDTVVDGLATRLPAALVGGRIDASIGAIVNSTTAADNLKNNADRVIPVTFSNGGTVTTAVLLTVDGVTPSAIDDTYNGRTFVFSLPANLKDSGATITDYNGTTKVATISAVTEAVTSTAVAIMT